jgi:hypothetical protein
MRPLPDWKWRRDPRIKIFGKLSKSKHKLLKCCYSKLEKDAVESIFNHLKTHLQTKILKMEMTHAEVIHYLDTIEFQPLPIEWDSMERRSYMRNRIPEDEEIKIWNSLMFQLMLYQTHKNS